jgi:hypothetical protein
MAAGRMTDQNVLFLLYITSRPVGSRLCDKFSYRAAAMFLQKNCPPCPSDALCEAVATASVFRQSYKPPATSSVMNYCALTASVENKSSEICVAIGCWQGGSGGRDAVRLYQRVGSERAGAVQNTRAGHSI